VPRRGPPEHKAGASPRRGKSGGDLAAVLGQHATDRLDPKLTTHNSRHQVVTMLVDEPHERGDGRSSSAAKKAEAVFKIAFAPAQSILRRS
jgi:hypothetical protein